jgi:hypothetical protein
MSDREPGLEVLQEPDDGTAGLGVRYQPRPESSPQTDVRIEMLWPNGESEPVYVEDDHLGPLINELIYVHNTIRNND